MNPLNDLPERCCICRNNIEDPEASVITTARTIYFGETKMRNTQRLQFCSDECLRVWHKIGLAPAVPTVKESDEETRRILSSCACDKGNLDDGPTILDPQDIYTMFEKYPGHCRCVGIYTLEDADRFVMRMFIPESWPDRLKNAKNG